MSTLKGKTLFITGASRGIGLAIALRAARDGANIVIAAKTTEPHPALPGTIYTAAEDIEKAGGKALPCVVDIRFEDQVRAAVDKAVSTFGGIDILVNNASAISLTGTLDTPMKRWDLMHGVNARGSFLCGQVCIPHLAKAANPHILSISPPLNMDVKWFKNHVAYTMSKYGMSICAMAWSEELRDAGIAANALWPRTVIDTAAVRNLLGGEAVASQGRTPEIMGDAAHAILTRPSREYTGHFAVDDDILRETGVTDFAKYNASENAKLLPDFFLD
ncbi:MAG: NAD(P)-dependent oxidoreductase [Polyangiales bacterium]